MNQHLAKIVSIVFNFINNTCAPKSIKDVIEPRNRKYHLKSNGILKETMANTSLDLDTCFNNGTCYDVKYMK